jgi:hypothetical protein
MSEPTTKTIHFQELQCGFEWGGAKLTRLFSDDKKGWVTFGVSSRRFPQSRGMDIQIYVTKTGKIRIHSANGEWKAPKKKTTP